LKSETEKWVCPCCHSNSTLSHRLQQKVAKATKSPGQPPVITKTTDDVARWIEERDILLQTGLYSSDDPTITRLDHQIRTAMAAKHNHPIT